MALVTNIVRRAEIPHEAGEWMELRRLSWKELEEAATAEQAAQIERMKGFDKNMLDAIAGAGSSGEMAKAVQEERKRSAYNKQSVLSAGIKSWSYDAEVTAENIELLDADTANWAYDEILNLNNPRTEEEAKNV